MRAASEEEAAATPGRPTMWPSRRAAEAAALEGQAASALRLEVAGASAEPRTPRWQMRPEPLPEEAAVASAVQTVAHRPPVEAAHPVEAAASAAPRFPPRAGAAVASAAQVAAVARQHPAALAAQAARASHQAVPVARRPDARVARAWPGSAPAAGPPHRGTTRTGSSTASRAVVSPLPPPAGPREPGPGPASPPSTRGKPRTNHRTCPFPCCGNRTSCTRSRSVHLHSVHHVGRLRGGHRGVDQVHRHG